MYDIYLFIVVLKSCLDAFQNFICFEFNMKY